MSADLLDLAFFKLDMLTHDGVILPLDHFFSHRAGVLLSDIEETCTSCAVQANFDLVGFAIILVRKGMLFEGAPLRTTLA